MAEETPVTPVPPTSDSIPITDPTASASIPIDLNPEYDPAKDTRAPFLKVNPNPKGPTVEAAPAPTLAERAKKVVTEGIPRYSSRTVENPKYGQEQFLSPEEALTPEEQRKAPVAAGALEAAGGLTSPATIGTVAATAGVGEAGIIPKVLSGLFAGQIAKSVYDQYPALKAAVDTAQHAKTKAEHDDAFAEAQQLLTHMGADTVMGLLAAAHGADGAKELLDKTTGSGVPDQASTFKSPGAAPAAIEPEETHPEMNRQTVKDLQNLGYSNQHITNFNIGEIRDILKNQTPASEAKIPTTDKANAPDPDKFAEAGGKLVSQPAPVLTSAATPPNLYTKDGAQTLADHVGAQVVGSVAEKGTSKHDLDLHVDTYDQPKIEAAMKAKGFAPVGSSIVSPAEAKASGKNYGGTPTDWSRAHHFESTSEPRQKVDIWHNEPADPVEALIMSDKIKGKKVRGATPTSAEAVAPDPEALAEHGGKFVGKAPEPAVAGAADIKAKAVEDGSYLVMEKGKAEPQDVADHRGFLLSDGSFVGSAEPYSEEDDNITGMAHGDIAAHLGVPELHAANAIRIAGSNMFEIYGRPTEHQLSEMGRLAKESGENKVIWDFHSGSGASDPGNMGDALENLRGKHIDSGHGSVGDFRRAIDKAYPEAPPEAFAEQPTLQEWKSTVRNSYDTQHQSPEAARRAALEHYKSKGIEIPRDWYDYENEPGDKKFAESGGKFVGKAPEPAAPTPTHDEQGRSLNPKDYWQSSITVPESRRGSEAQVIAKGGWLLPDGQNFVHGLNDAKGREETHGESALAMGYTNPRSDALRARVDALKEGAIRATLDGKTGTTTLETFGITDKSKHRLMDALAAAPPDKPVTLAWGQGNPRLDSPKEFANPEEAIDWVDRQTPQSGPDPKAHATTGGKLVGKAPEPAATAPAEPYHPDLQKVTELPGVEVHRDPSKIIHPERGSFIAPDGKFVTLPVGMDHDKAIAQVNPDRPHSSAMDNRVGFVNDAQTIRLRPWSDRAGTTLHFTIPKDGVTPEQVDALKLAVGGGMRSRGNFIFETADTPANLKSSEQQMASPAHVDEKLKEIGAHPDQKGIVQKELQTPHKETYGMEVTDQSGNSMNTPIDAHSSKQAIIAAQKKFPDASEWRVAKTPEDRAPSTEYSVPTGKLAAMPYSGGFPVVNTIRHEVAHALIALKHGLGTGGIISGRYPKMPSDARAAHLLFAPKGPGGTIRPDKRSAVLASGLAGIAADEAFNDYPRSINHNFSITEDGDGKTAYETLTAAGFTHEAAMAEMHQLIDENINDLKHPAMAGVIHENENVRENGLSRQFHYSPERLQNMHAEIERRKANEGTGSNNPATDEATPAGSKGDVARAEGGISQTGAGEPQEGPIANAENQTNKPNLRNGVVVEQNGARGQGGSPQTTEAESAETEKGIVSEEKIKKTVPEVSPNDKLQASAQKYAAAHDMPEINHEHVEADPERAREIAKIYDEAKHDPNDPRVKAAYTALKSETLAQFHHLRDDLKLKFKPQEEDPYTSAEGMMDDIKKKNQLKVFTESSVGPDHPLAAIAPGTGGQTYNTVFRWVHDAMGHAAGGNDFSENGEKSATEAHAQMYSDTARPAMRAETEGQTSWFFHNPAIEAGKAQPGAFAEQKATILPDVSADWHKAAGKMAATDEAGGINPRTGKSDTKGVGTEILPEVRQNLDHAPTPADFAKFYDQHKDIFDKHPELRVGFDNNSAVKGGHEINIGAVGPNAAKVAAKLDQKSAFDIAKGEVIPTGGTGLKTEFKDYPLEDRIKDLKGQSDHTVSTRMPTKKVKGETIENHTDQSRTSDMDAAKAAPGYVQKMVNRTNETPGFTPPDGTAQEQADAYIRHAADNIKFVHGKLTKEEFDRDSQWYPVGAYERGQAVAKQHDFTPHQVYGVTSVESPMTDWDANTALAERTANIWKNQQNTKFTPEMQTAADKITSLPANKNFKVPFKQIAGKTLAELPNTELQGFWLRLYDEAHNPRSYEKWGPDGKSLGLAKNQDGSPKKVGWSFQSHINKAIEIMKDGSDENISKNLGKGHKVRNFYNNQVAPDDPRFLTMDTHAINIAQLRPMSGKTKAVRENFGTITNGAHGLKGTYAIHDAAYRLAAKELDIDIPSRLQSPTWVKIREVFTDDFKTKENQDAVDAIWKEHEDGKITADDARNKVWDYAVEWNRKNDAGNEPAPDQGKLFAGGVHGESARGTARRGTGSGTAREVPAAGVDEGDTSFDFGANKKSQAEEDTAKVAEMRKAKISAMQTGLSGLRKPGKK